MRLRERVAFVFARLYGTPELHCSKDGFTLLRPPRAAAEVSRGDWSHFDQVRVCVYIRAQRRRRLGRQICRPTVLGLQG